MRQPEGKYRNMLSLSRRESEIAGHLALGKTEKEVAEELFLSVDTIHAHKKNIFRKWGAKSVVDVARMFIEHIVKVDVSKLIKKEISEMSTYKVCVTLFLLSLQFVASYHGVEQRRTRMGVKSISVSVCRTRKNE